MPYFGGATAALDSSRVRAPCDHRGCGRTDPLTGRLLVAAPQLRDQDFFGRSVVLLLAHGDEGALGLVLNRPSDHRRVGEAAPGLERASGRTRRSCSSADPSSVPTPSAWPAVGAADGSEGWQPLFGRLGTLDLTLTPDDIGVPVERIRVFLGHAGWAAGQLEDEIEAEMWFVRRRRAGRRPVRPARDPLA